MEVNFFEEFPRKKGVLEKIELVDFPCKLFIGAESVEEFRKHEKYVESLNEDVECGYWPLLKMKEGYWMSPFSDPSSLDRVMDELRKEKNLKVLWDAELPTLRPSLFFKNLFNFKRQKRKVLDFLSGVKNKLDIYSAEYFTPSKWLKFLGVSFNRDVTRVPMYYTSIPVPGKLEALKNTDEKIVGLGLTAKGVGPLDQVISYEDIHRDLSICESNGVEEVFIFRLGGLDKRYLNVLEEFT